MKVHPVKFIIIIVVSLVFIGLVGFADNFHLHDDPFYHKNCPICQWQLILSAILLFIVTLVATLLGAPTALLSQLKQRVLAQHVSASIFLRAPPSSPSLNASIFGC